MTDPEEAVAKEAARILEGVCSPETAKIFGHALLKTYLAATQECTKNETPCCTHDLAEMETACADGMCPICLSAKLTAQKAAHAKMMRDRAAEWDTWGTSRIDHKTIATEYRRLADKIEGGE